MDAELSDADLALRIASADASAEFEAQLYRRFSRRTELYGRKHLGTRDAAQELVHEVMLRVFDAIRNSRLENPARLGLSAGNVRVIPHRALAKLAGCVNPEDNA